MYVSHAYRVSTATGELISESLLVRIARGVAGSHLPYIFLWFKGDGIKILFCFLIKSVRERRIIDTLIRTLLKI